MNGLITSGKALRRGSWSAALCRLFDDLITVMDKLDAVMGRFERVILKLFAIASLVYVLLRIARDH